jgi:hypothetical protein
MAGFDSLVLQEQRHLKWRALDPVENLLMILCGVCITGFSVLVLGDVITRAIGRPWLWVQEATMTFFLYGIFIGVAAATRCWLNPCQATSGCSSRCSIGSSFSRWLGA